MSGDAQPYAVESQADPIDVVIGEVDEMLPCLPNVMERLRVGLEHAGIPESLAERSPEYCDIPCERWEERITIEDGTTWNVTDPFALWALFFESVFQYTNTSPQERFTLTQCFRDNIHYHTHPFSWGSRWFDNIDDDIVEGVYEVARMIDVQQGL